MTWPLGKNLSTHVTPGQQSIVMVSQLNIWTLAWNHHWMDDPSRVSYWDANNFYPHEGTLAYSEPQFVTSLLTWPLALAGLNPVLWYNIIFMLFFASSGWALYRLSFYIINRLRDGQSEFESHMAAFVAGVLFGFNPYMFRELGVLQLFAMAFPTLTILHLIQFTERPSWSKAILAAVYYVACWNTCAYYGLFLTIFVLALIAFLATKRWLSKAYLFPGLLAVLIVFVCMMPLAQGMLASKDAISMERTRAMVEVASEGTARYFAPPEDSLLYGHLLGVGQSSQSLFLGGLIVAFGLVGACMPCGRSVQNSRVYNYFKMMAILALLLSYGMALAPTSPDGLGFFSFVYWLSPYNLLYEYFPGYSSVRSPNRFSIFAALFLAVLAGAGMYGLSRKVNGPVLRRGLLSLFLLFSLIEVWPINVRLFALADQPETVSNVYQVLAGRDDMGAVLELPNFQPPDHPTADAEYMLSSIHHWHPLINGYSGFGPNAYQQLVEMFQVESSPDRLFAAIQSFSPRYLIIHWDRVERPYWPVWSDMLSKGTSVLAEDGNTALYELADRAFSVEMRLDGLCLHGVDVVWADQNWKELSILVSLGLGSGNMFLVSPWHHPIRVTAKWMTIDGNSVVLEDQAIYGNSLLIDDESLADIRVRSPGAGRFRVEIVVKVGHVSKKVYGICEIHPSGFISFVVEVQR